VFSFALVMLWDGWLKHNQPPTVAQQPAAAGAAAPADGSVPTPTLSATAPGQPVVPGEQAAAATSAPRVVVETDLLRAEVSAQGGDIVRLELKQHKASGEAGGNFVLLDDGTTRHQYAAQSGLIGEGLPTHKTMFQLPGSELHLKDGEDAVELRLQAPEQNGVQVTKVMRFQRGSYLVDIAYEIRNGGAQALAPHAYFQLTRDGNAAEQVEAFGVTTFAGPAFYTDPNKFQKVSFEDITDAARQSAKPESDGSVAVVLHYLVRGSLPDEGLDRDYSRRGAGNTLISACVSVPMPAIDPGA